MGEKREESESESEKEDVMETQSSPRVKTTNTTFITFTFVSTSHLFTDSSVTNDWESE